MSKRTWILAAAAASALALCTPDLRAQTAPAQSAPSTSEEIKALRQRLDQLEAQQKASELQHQETERKLEAKLTAEQLNAEASRRDQFLSQEGFTAGYSENRFTVGSSDGSFTLRPWYHLQFRETTVDRIDVQGTKNNLEDQWDTGFEVRRMKIGLDGNMFSHDFTYFFNWATSRTSSNSTVSGATPAKAGTAVTVSNGLGGVPILEEAWVRYRIPATDFFIKAGQIKDPLLHDQIVSSRYQQSAERSLTADLFANGDAFTEGITVIYDPNVSNPDAPIRIEAGINHGMRSANTNFFSYHDNGNFNQFNWGAAGRVELKAMGHWKDYGQIGGVGTKDPLLVFGVGTDYSERGHAGQTVAVMDAMFAHPCGFNAYAAFVDRYTTHNFGIETVSATGASIGTPDPKIANHHTNETSILIQAGYIINQHLEPFGRWEIMELAGTAAGSRNNIQVVTGGLNYYFYGHRLKLTTEIMFLPDGIPVDDNGGDVLVQANGKSEISFVTQLQLLL